MTEAGQSVHMLMTCLL